MASAVCPVTSSTGIPAPRVITLKQHVLVMDFIGHDGWPAPRLHDVKLDEDHWRNCYVQLIKATRTIYHDCMERGGGGGGLRGEGARRWWGALV